MIIYIIPRRYFININNYVLNNNLIMLVKYFYNLDKEKIPHEYLSENKLA